MTDHPLLRIVEDARQLGATSVSLGSSPEVYAAVEAAIPAGAIVERRRQWYGADRRPLVVEALYLTVDRVEVRVQRSRPPTQSEVEEGIER